MGRRFALSGDYIFPFLEDLLIKPSTHGKYSSGGDLLLDILRCIMHRCPRLRRVSVTLSSVVVHKPLFTSIVRDLDARGVHLLSCVWLRSNAIQVATRTMEIAHSSIEDAN